MGMKIRMNDDLIHEVSKGVLILGIIICILSLFIFTDPKPIILGLIFGGIVSVLNFRLLDNSVSKSVTMPADRASRYSFKHYMIRYIISFLVLLVAALADYLNILSTMVGLLLVKLVIIIDYAFFNKLQEKK